MKLQSRSFAHSAAVLYDPETASDIATIHPTGEHAKTRDLAARLAATWNACHGLDIPPDIAPGALAALVRAALSAVPMHGLPTMQQIAKLRVALAPFTPDPAPPVSPPAQWGIFRKAVKTGLGDMPESLITWEPSKEAAEAQLIKLLRSSDIYYMRELRPDEREELMGIHEEQIHKDALLAAFGEHGQG